MDAEDEEPKPRNQKQDKGPEEYILAKGRERGNTIGEA